ncbi:glycosyltransferase [Suttonella ornithocola]|uniref:UDP-galactofuranosyl transferase GlfT2 n=1 Tax=Suttonella ornithocola TaxID=279832 RepID=A0A380MVW0_9GAMM|nr:glycosyltransferase [Suttonella ornithocola]SUO95537.1 UDP-galactofuranosyl transferase GlfT2 [Suttonella ornithocola]
MNIVQKIIFPSILCSERDLYFRCNDFVEINRNDLNIKFLKGGKLSTNTYFNSISIEKIKRKTNIEKLSFRIKAKGNIKISFHWFRLDYSDVILDESYFLSEQIHEEIFELNFWNKLSDGMLAIDFHSLDVSEIISCDFCTSSVPTNKVKLGIVITHFNRQNYLIPAMERLNLGLLNDSEIKENVDVFVVDNSNNLPELDKINIIKNKNLGGAGGFTRGLLHLTNTKQYTHCLFMDDDASCEIESIRRTIILLKYAKNPNQCIAGAMLREVESFRQFENGARFDGLCRPLKPGLDLRDVRSLLINEVEENIDYGGWWFFAFPISIIKYYAFPYFVRGDDVGFCLAHKFNIMTLNGICSWQDDFMLKQSPLNQYLDTRSHIVHSLQGLTKNGCFKSTLIIFKMFARNALTYQYETANAINFALEDILAGSEFWRSNVDMLRRRKEVLALVKDEKLVDIPYNIYTNLIFGNPHEKRIRKLIRIITLNGHLIPQLLFKSELVWQHKGFGGNLREVFLFKKILYIHWPTKKGFILQHSKPKFFKASFYNIKLLLKFISNYSSLKKDYTTSYKELTSETFWNKQFKD